MNASTCDEFEKYYADSYTKVYRLALSLAGNENDAEDITQEAFCRAFRSFGTFRRDSSFFTWIYRIALNVGSSYMKQRRIKMPVEMLTEDMGYSLDDIFDENPSSDPETLYLAKEVKVKCLNSLITCLSGEQRKIFCLAITISLPYKQVAEILECSVSKVKTTVHRAKQRWFGYMEDRCSLIKRSNPCHCIQWIRFGIEQGWFSKEDAKKNMPVIDPFSSGKCLTNRYNYRRFFVMSQNDLAMKIRDKALELGFEGCGIIGLDELRGYEEMLDQRIEACPKSKTLLELTKNYARPETTYPWAKAVVICITRYGKYKIPKNLEGLEQ